MEGDTDDWLVGADYQVATADWFLDMLLLITWWLLLITGWILLITGG